MSSAPTSADGKRAQIDLVYKFSGENALILTYGFKFTVDNIFFRGDPYKRSMHLDFSSTIFNNVISFGYLNPNDLPKTSSSTFKDVQSFYEGVVIETRATFCTFKTNEGVSV